MPIELNSADELTEEQIAQLKEDYGRIYKVCVAGVDYVIRPMFKVDWDIVMLMLKDNPNMGTPDMDDKIVDRCLICPRPDVATGGWSTIPAGVPSTLSKMISVKSGFIVPELSDASDFSVEPLFEESVYEKPDEEEVKKLKKLCPFDLKLVGIGGEWFVVRPITRAEWRYITKNATDEGEQDIKVVQKTVLWPKGIDWNDKPAGYCDTLAQLTMNISGYAGPSTVEEL